MALLIDIDVYGRKKITSDSTQHLGDLALANALIFFLTSRRGDFYDDPSAGGALQELEFKPLSRDLDPFIKKVQESVEFFFDNYLTIELFEIEPSVFTRSWEITIVFKSLATQETTKVEFDIGSKIPQSTGFLTKPLKSVLYTGDNLYNFVLLHLPEMKGHHLNFDIQVNKWVWNFLSFDNFTNADPRYNDIITTINNN